MLCQVATSWNEQAPASLAILCQTWIGSYCVFFEIVISALAKKLQWRHGATWMSWTEHSQDTVIYNTSLSACSKAREVVQAKNLLVQMRKSGIQPNVMSYTCHVGLCQCGSLKDALAVLISVTVHRGVVPLRIPLPCDACKGM
jgi:pentatricopeptide repeat protein